MGGRCCGPQRRRDPLLLAYILAGGLSSRFGRDKAMHLVDGTPMVARVAGTLAAAGLAPVVVARERRPLELVQVLEPDGPRHPLWGIACALAHAGAAGQARALVAPCDLPGLAEAQVRALVAASAAGPCRAAGQPLLAILEVAMRGEIEGGALAGAAALDILCALPEIDLGPIENLNRPRR